MRLGEFEFAPGLWPTLATLAVLPLLVGLGLWQLERAEWKQGLIDRHAAMGIEAAHSVAAVLAEGGDNAHRPVYASGQYDLERQLLLDNQLHQGVAGYHVLTPLRLAGGDTVLVNRGWLPVGASRQRLPALPGPDGAVQLRGRIARLPEKIFRLDSAEEQHKGWPQVIQHIVFEDIEARLGHAVQPAVILLDEQDAHGFTRAWKAVYSTPPAKHRAYAMQWFTLAVVLLLIYLGVNMRRIREHDENE